MEFKEIKEKILAKTFFNKKSSDNPKIVFISGQTGAGKSTYISTIEDSKSVLIIPDEYLLATTDIINNEVKMKFISEISNEIEKKAIENKNNIIEESTVIYPDYYIREADKFRKKGYEVEFIIVATNKEISGSRMLNRNEQQYKNSEVRKVEPRIGTLEIHNQLSYLLQNTLRELEESKKFDNIKLVQSTGKVLYNSKTSKEPLAEEFFIKELNRKLIKDEINEVKKLKEQILSSMQERRDKKFEIIKKYFEFNEKFRENTLLKSLKQKNIKNKKENEKER